MVLLLSRRQHLMRAIFSLHHPAQKELINEIPPSLTIVAWADTALNLPTRSHTSS